MARKIYKRIGIRRDRNLADLSDTKQGLNSLIDSLNDKTGLQLSFLEALLIFKLNKFDSLSLSFL